MIMDSQAVFDIIQRTLTEDLGTAGDITTTGIFDKSETATAAIKSKQAGVLSGTYLLQPIFRFLDPSLSTQILAQDGTVLSAGTRIAMLSGSLPAILAGERTALNFLQRLSGIATQTAELVSLIRHTKAKLLDTRKTTPLLRMLEKKAVVDGGGFNHRFGLFDMVLIKDTHVKAAGSVGKAIIKAKKSLSTKTTIKIEAEVQSIDEFRDALAQNPDRVMLDNMPVDTIRKCVAIRNAEKPAIELEASGNVTRYSIAGIAETGVDFISSGSITHSVMALDIHLVIV
jgi:nicotinate-nucleotide pyrophosphorylase (carboxylating)